jgi:hypothetical protein
MTASRTTSPVRARRSFWILLLVSVLAAGSLSNALASASGQITGVRVAVSGLVLVIAMTLAGRVMIALDRAHRQARTASKPPHKSATATTENRRK